MHVDCMQSVGQLKYPNDVAVDSCGNILVMDGAGAELKGLKHTQKYMGLSNQVFVHNIRGKFPSNQVWYEEYFYGMGL